MEDYSYHGGRGVALMVIAMSAWGWEGGGGGVRREVAGEEEEEEEEK